jgi:hypothetical protein
MTKPLLDLFQLRRHNVINFAELRPDGEDDSYLAGPTCSPPVIGPRFPKLSFKQNQTYPEPQDPSAQYKIMFILHLYY